MCSTLTAGVKDGKSVKKIDGITLYLIFYDALKLFFIFY